MFGNKRLSVWLRCLFLVDTLYGLICDDIRQLSCSTLWVSEQYRPSGFTSSAASSRLRFLSKTASWKRLWCNYFRRFACY